MASQTIPDSTLAALNDKELEIFRLLAAGHTVTSIAASLDRSETAINERLRESRRKTGVGSSRELARLLDAQKIRDRKSDLPCRDISSENRSQSLAERLCARGVSTPGRFPVPVEGLLNSVPRGCEPQRRPPARRCRAAKRSEQHRGRGRAGALANSYAASASSPGSRST